MSPVHSIRSAAPLAILLVLCSTGGTLAQAPRETLVDIIVHGNHATSDAAILDLAGLTIGAPVSERVIDEATQRLRESHRFAAVEIRKRYASIADPSRIVLVLLIEERPGASSGNPTPGPLDTVLTLVQWMPVVTYEDGYGFTYGARLTLDDPRRRFRMSLPLTWGGMREAGVVAEHRLAHAPLDRVIGSFAITRREHPAYDVGDTRRRIGLEVDRMVLPSIRLAASARAARVSFGGLTESLAALQARAVLDTRVDPTFPRDALFASLSWERLAFGRHGPAQRITTDVRAYVGLAGSTVLALRAQGSTASAPLPRYERALLGGSASLRGVRLGSSAGDNLLGGSVELRLPLSSPLRSARLGLRTFVDAATTWNVGQRIATRRFFVGAGAGAYLGAGPLTISLDAGRSRGRTRLHFGLGRGW